MNSVKIRNASTNEISVIKYPTVEAVNKAKMSMKHLSFSGKAYVPCDIETGKTKKLVNVRNWQVA